MAEKERKPGEVWDEHDWERFLRRQDRRTERYMELMEKYLDDPERDRIIAGEMGWSQLLDETTADPRGAAKDDDLDDDDDEEDEDGDDEDEDEDLDDDDEEEDEDLDDGDEDEDEDEDEDGRENRDDETLAFERHPLYRACVSLNIWVDRFLAREPHLEERPAAVRLATSVALSSAKLAAALGDGTSEEIGRSIAFFKRALKAVNDALGSTEELWRTGGIGDDVRAQFRQRLFEVRDGIVTRMGEARAQWRARYGP